jgi:hypothetical protein
MPTLVCLGDLEDKNTGWNAFDQLFDQFDSAFVKWPEKS